MKSKLLLALASGILPLTALAVPATPEPIKVTNPDGSTMQIRAFGDEFFHYTTDMSGKKIMHKDNRGYWTPMTIDGREMTTTAADISLLRSMTPVYKPLEAAKTKRTSPAKMAEIGDDCRTTYNTKGETHGLVIIVEFQDVKFETATDPRQAYDDLCNKEGYSEFGSVGSAADYYKAVSNGQFNPKFDVYGPVKLKNNRAYYSQNSPNGASRDRIYEIIYEAITALDPEVDFSQYDLDNNGTIDNLYVFYAGNGAADTVDLQYIWPHQGDYRDYVTWAGATPITVDGVEMATYACSNEVKAYTPPGNYATYWRDGIGTFTHEYSHVLGLPDMYDTDTQNTDGTSSVVSPGKFDIMDFGPYNEYATCPPGYSAYEKWFCHWLEFEELTEPQSVELPLMSLQKGETNKAYRITVKRDNRRYWNEWFIFENREKTSWDSSLPEHGMIIWHIDYDQMMWASNKPNTNGVARIEIIPSFIDGSIRYNSWPGYFNKTSSTPLDADNGSALTPRNKCNPAFDTWITSIKKADDGVVSFNYNLISEQPTIKTTLHEPVIEQDGHNITYTWDAVEGAQDYLLTVIRTDSKGQERYVDNCNERTTLGATTYTSYGLTPVAWQQDFRAYVRVVTELPSKETSNVVKFMPDNSGVEGIEASYEAIYGGYGYISAPDSAIVTSINGVRTGKENLPAGIYIVNYNGKSHKVMVK